MMLSRSGLPQPSCCCSPFPLLLKSNIPVMKQYLPLFLLCIIAACNSSEKKVAVKQKTITRDFQVDLNALLPSGEYTVDIMDKIKMSPRRQELQDKFMTAMKADPEWFLQQQRFVEETGKEPPYDARLGMTEAEWAEYKSIMNNVEDMEAEPSGSEKLIISNVGGIIRFKSTGKLEYINFVSIDIHNKEVYIFDHRLGLLDTICVKNDKNVFKTAWRGYEFQFTDNKNIGIPKSSEELKNISMKLFTFTLGLFPNSGRTYIEISGSEVNKGKDLVRFKVPFLIRK